MEEWGIRFERKDSQQSNTSKIATQRFNETGLCPSFFLSDPKFVLQTLSLKTFAKETLVLERSAEVSMKHVYEDSSTLPPLLVSIIVVDASDFFMKHHFLKNFVKGVDIFSGLKINDTLFFCLGVLCPFISPTKSEQTQINEKNFERVFLFSNEKSFTYSLRDVLLTDIRPRGAGSILN